MKIDSQKYKNYDRLGLKEHPLAAYNDKPAADCLRKKRAMSHVRPAEADPPEGNGIFDADRCVGGAITWGFKPRRCPTSNISCPAGSRRWREIYQPETARECYARSSLEDSGHLRLCLSTNFQPRRTEVDLFPSPVRVCSPPTTPPSVLTASAYLSAPAAGPS
jgi:hypothetical protein